MGLRVVSVNAMFLSARLVEEHLAREQKRKRITDEGLQAFEDSLAKPVEIKLTMRKEN